MIRNKTLLIDFDDTIHDTKDVEPGHRMGKPMPGGVAAMRYLKSFHNTLIILTGRPVNNPSVHKAVCDWLDYFEIPYDEVTNVKPSGYDYVVDNRAIHFDAWDRTLVMLNHLDSKEAEEKFTHEDLDLHVAQNDISY